MLKPFPALLPHNTNPAIIAWFERIENACLALLILISTMNLAEWLTPGPNWTILAEWLPMRPESALTALLSTLCLMFLGTGQSRWNRWISPFLAASVILLAVMGIVHFSIPYTPELAHAIASFNGTPDHAAMSSAAAAAYLLLGITMMAMTVERRFAIWVSDLLTLASCLLTLTLASGYLFGKWSIFGISANFPMSRGTAVCLMLLTALAVLRRSEDGIFSIFAGTGTGGQLARLLSPVLLLAPFLREGTRARILGTGSMPPHYVTPLLASPAAIVSLSMLLYLVWRINAMENEIHALALRDELTGLHNLRGFQLLAEQAMRLAQRSKVPFSVVFVDLDDLKVINDSLGHQAGSNYISEAAEILRSNFREADVLGRIGGDEFAVAGQFSRRAIASMVQRMEDACAHGNSIENRKYALSFSVGCVTHDESKEVALAELMAEADQAMYEAKRKKKERSQVRPIEAVRQETEVIG